MKMPRNCPRATPAACCWPLSHRSGSPSWTARCSAMASMPAKQDARQQLNSLPSIHQNAMEVLFCPCRKCHSLNICGYQRFSICEICGEYFPLMTQTLTQISADEQGAHFNEMALSGMKKSLTCKFQNAPISNKLTGPVRDQILVENQAATQHQRPVGLP